MTESPCLCGYTTVRKAARFVGRFQFWFGIIALIMWFIVFGKVLSKLFRPESESSLEDLSKKSGVVIIMYMSLYLAIIISWIYGGHSLIKATFSHNLRSIDFWLKINAVFCIIGIVDGIISLTGKIHFEKFILDRTAFCIEACMWIVVYQFYKDEKASEAINIDNLENAT